MPTVKTAKTLGEFSESVLTYRITLIYVTLCDNIVMSSTPAIVAFGMSRYSNRVNATIACHHFQILL